MRPAHSWTWNAAGISDGISAGQIGRISGVGNVIVSNSLTPDQSAEFGGSLVQVKTKNIPTENSFSVNIGASYNDKTPGRDFRAPDIPNSAYQ